jgi:hypothetical protein
MEQINIIEPTKLQTLYGMSDAQKTTAFITAGAVTGIVLMLVIRSMRRKKKYAK